MAIFVVERSLPGVTPRQVQAIQRAAGEMTLQLRAEGREVRYLSSLFIPVDSRCLCLFEAADAALAQELNDRAQLPYDRILNAARWEPAASR